MRFRQQQRMYIGWFLVSLICALIGSSMGGCKKKAPAEAEPAVSPTAQPVKTPDTPPASKPSMLPLPGIKLADVIATAKSWTPKEIDFSGPLPEVTLTDLAGKTHSLSDYRGRNVLLTFWATWDPHCKFELPQLGQLRNEFKTDELTILAISVVNERNPETAIRAYVQGQSNINYPVVATTAEALPNPLNQVEFLPCSFFINPKGEVKLVTQGQVPVNDIKSILRGR